MTDFLAVKNWEDHQTYRDGRKMWFIKVQTALLDDYGFEQLTEVQQAHLMKIWLIAAKTDNKIPNDPAWIGKKIGAKSAVNLMSLIEAGFLRLYEPVQECTKTEKVSSISISSISSNSLKESKEARTVPNAVPEYWTENGLEDEYRAFRAMRVRIKKPITSDLTANRLIGTHQKLVAEGHDGKEILLTALDRCWQTFYPPKGNAHQGRKAESNAERQARLANELSN